VTQMIVRQIRLSNHARERLIRLKAKTGIQNWNILCRWALCLSLSEPSVPQDKDIPADSNVEMSWHVFGGEFHELYSAAVKQRCIEDGLGTSPDVVAKYFRLHLHRGIDYLSATNLITSLESLFSLMESGEHPESRE
jgi:DNA sulfur modification protein DndE